MEEERGFTDRAFSAYALPLEMVTSFKYPGRVISATENDRPEVVRNLDRAKMLWRRMLHILRKEGATPRVSGFFFKGVKQTVLILGRETWFFTPRMGEALAGVQTKVARRLTVKLPHRTTNRIWKYTSAEAVREAAGLLTIEEFIRRSQNTATQYIAVRHC